MNIRTMEIFLNGNFMEVINEAIAPEKWDMITLNIPTHLTVREFLSEIKIQLKLKLLAYTDNVPLVILYCESIYYPGLLFNGKTL